MTRSFWACALVALATACASAAPPRATKPLVLADFRSPESAAKWSGLPVTRVAAPGAPGQYRGRFTVPRYVKGAEMRPAAILAWDGGRGYRTRDFRPWGLLAVDAWIDGDQAEKLGLKLRDGRKDASWTTWVTLQPHCKTVIPLATSVAGADMNIADAREIVLYAKQSPATFTVLIGSVRLVPRPRPPLATFYLMYPNYRGLIVPGDGDPLIDVHTEPGEYHTEARDLVLTCSAEAGVRRVVVRRRLHSADGSAVVPVRSLPCGRVVLTATVSRRGRRALVTKRWEVRKLTRAEVSRLRVYVDRWCNLIVDGKPFFPLGFYDGFTPRNVDEMAAGGFNCVINYGVSHQTKAELKSYLDLLASKGMKCIFNISDLYPGCPEFKGRTWDGIAGNEAVTTAMVEAFKDNPALLSWYLNEERTTNWAPQLRKQYQKVCALDPAHPCSMVHCNRHVVPWFDRTTDIFGMDPYPIPNEPITRVSEFLDVVRRGTRGRESMWLVPETFAWYQFDENAANRDRGRIPTPEEWRTGRPPSNDEMRCMIYLGLAHGAKGLIGFSYYNMRVLPQYPAMWANLQRIAAEIKQIEPALLTRSFPLPVRVTPAGAPVHTRLLRHDGRLTLIAVNVGREACRATIDVERPIDPSVTECFTKHTLTATGSRLTVDFKPLEARVFALQPAGR